MVLETGLKNCFFIFSLVLKCGFFFFFSPVSFNCTSCFLHLSNDRVKTEMSVATVITRMWSGNVIGI
jgi:hypothetical protein